MVDLVSEVADCLQAYHLSMAKQVIRLGPRAPYNDWQKLYILHPLNMQKIFHTVVQSLPLQLSATSWTCTVYP